jgi:hypothetical protein
MEMDDTVTLHVHCDRRIAQLLRATRHYAWVAQLGARPRMQDALTQLKDTLSDQLAALENAEDDDKSDAEDSGEAARERQAWQPLRAA